jgi:hypothetical protein
MVSRGHDSHHRRSAAIHPRRNADPDPTPGKVVDDKIAPPPCGQSTIGSHHRPGDAGEGDVPTEEAPGAREKTADVVAGIEQGCLENVVPTRVGTVEPGLNRIDRSVLTLPGQVVELLADHVILDEELFEHLDEDVEDGPGERETDGVAFRLG